MAEPRDITNPSRRATLGALAAAPVVALLGASLVPMGVDPIFSAIERHRGAFHRFDAALVATDEVLADEERREVTQAHRDDYEAASAAETKALDALVETPPTTLRGLRAVIEYLGMFDRYSLPEASGRFLPTLLKSPLLAA